MKCDLTSGTGGLYGRYFGTSLYIFFGLKITFSQVYVHEHHWEVCSSLELGNQYQALRQFSKHSQEPFALLQNLGEAESEIWIIGSPCFQCCYYHEPLQPVHVMHELPKSIKSVFHLCVVIIPLPFVPLK